MPTYEYTCPACGKTETRFNVKIAEADAQTCAAQRPSDAPGTGGQPALRACGARLERQLSLTAKTPYAWKP